MGHYRIPAPPFEFCPHCKECNDDKRTRVWRVADERGLHRECDVCAHAWTDQHGEWAGIPARGTR